MKLVHIARVGAAALLTAVMLGACASTVRVYVNPDADMAFYKKVVVMPFGNVSAEPLAGPRVTRAFITEMLITQRYQLIEPEDFNAVLLKVVGPPANDGTYDAAKIKEAATSIGATGILRGGVTEYAMQRTDSGDVPLLAFDAEMMDVATGNAVWRSSITKRGKSGVPFTGGSRSLGRLTQQACQELVQRLSKEKL
jgi:hypothetical protein